MTERRDGSTPDQAPREALSAEILHRHVDGELDEAGREALVRAAKLDPMVRARLEGLLEVRTLVQEAVEAQTPALDSEALWAAVQSKLAEGAAPSAEPVTAPAAPRPALRAISGGKSDATPADPAVRMRRIGAAFIGVVAIAAVAVLAIRSTDDSGEIARVDTTEDAGGPAVAPVIAVAEPARTEVLEVDFGTNIGTIFSIEGASGDRYAVVWLDESDAPTRAARPESMPGPAGAEPGATPN